MRRREFWEIVKFIIVLILAFIIATFPFWYPKEEKAYKGSNDLGYKNRYRKGRYPYTLSSPDLRVYSELTEGIEYSQGNNEEWYGIPMELPRAHLS